MRRVAIVALVAALALIGTGCGSSDSSSNDQASGTDQTRTVERTKVQVVEGIGGKNGINPASIYNRLSDGVVTVISLFGNAEELKNLKGGGGQSGLGSGFVLDEQGYVATNAHVVTEGTGGDIKQAKEVYVQFADGNEVPARVVGFDPNAEEEKIESFDASVRSDPVS